jgi:GntR family transcriptional repressor for pyruvate dehydrogenase complex
MSARKQVAERVQALLEEREVAPGDRLPPERQLAVELGVSRSTLREGLRRLVDLGIVEARQGSGTYVAPLDLDDLLEARLQLEPYAARLAARRRKAKDVTRLDRALAELRARRGDPAAFAAADARLHQAVTEAAGSVALRVLLAALADLLRRSRDTTASDPAVRAAAMVQLERLVEAIRAGDAVGAEGAMRAHLRDVGTALAEAR